VNPKPRYLTKSRFKIAHECPTKLFFSGKSEYGNNKVDNPFLEALAKGGFQVGELAKLYFEGGFEIPSLDSKTAIQETLEHLKKDEVTLYEAAIRFENLLIRVDILRKNADSVELIEVKSKSYDRDEQEHFYNKTELKQGVKKLHSEWEEYLMDIAFQTHVVRSAFPNWKVTSSLMLADKTAQANVDGLNQLFFLETAPAGRTKAIVRSGVQRKDLGDPVLIQIEVDEYVALILGSQWNQKTFVDYVSYLSEAYQKDQMVPPSIGKHCKSCEFRINADKKREGLRSGFEDCWSQAANLKASDFSRPLIFDLWNFSKSEGLIKEGRYFMSELESADIKPKPNPKEPGLSTSERQWMQIVKSNEGSMEPYLDREGLSSEMAQWKYPIHFIDFETTLVAIPFHKGRRPYEIIAFQFSHHIMHENGKVEHLDEYLNHERGKFPNFDMVRALKRALSKDTGTIFRYAAHENTVLCQIREQLIHSQESDRQELIQWIETITHAPSGSTQKWEGKRNMVDLLDLVKKYDYHPKTMGSNSIKKVLPAILDSSAYLQNRYSKPIYGSSEIQSKNFKDWSWIQRDQNGNLKDPYHLLPPLFSDLDLETMDSIITEKDLNDGGAAMTAYARMQFTQMTDSERERVCKALLRYCELDTFAMVLIVEYWMHEISEVKRGVA
jgi:hypothetical protein